MGTTERRNEAAGVIVVASTAAVVAASVIAAGMGAGALWVFEVLAATGVLVGLGVAFGALDRDPAARRAAARRRTRDPVVTPELSAAVVSRLADLDPVEHRRLDLGAPWPTVVVGPTGVSVVSVAGRVSPRATARLEQVVTLAASVVASLVPDRLIDVRGLLVVPAGETVATTSPRVRSVTADELDGAIALGGLVSMATVAAVFARLSGVLAPDLRLGAS